jgi:hypothetical protein
LNYVAPPALGPNQFNFNGQWTVGNDHSTAGANATIGLHYGARSANLVLGGTGTVTVRQGDKVVRTINVTGSPRLYQLTNHDKFTDETISLSATPGIQAYDLTFN